RPRAPATAAPVTVRVAAAAVGPGPRPRCPRRPGRRRCRPPVPRRPRPARLPLLRLPPLLPRPGAGPPGRPPAAATSRRTRCPAEATPWAGPDTTADGEDRSVPLPDTVFAPSLSEPGEDTPPPPSATADAKTALMSGGSQLPPTAVAPALPEPGAPMPPAADASRGGTPPPPTQAGPSPYDSAPGAGPGTGPQRPLAPNAGDIADAATSKATPPPRRSTGPTTPPPPG